MRAEQTDLDTIEDVPDQLLGPGGPTLGGGQDPDVVLPHLDVGQLVVVSLEPGGDSQQVAVCILLFDSHYVTILH